MNSSVEEIRNEKRQLLKKHLDKRIEENGILFNQCKDAILILDLEGHILKVNPSFIELSEYPVEEVERMKLSMIFPMESLDKVYHFFHKASLGEVQNFDCLMTTKNGENIDLNITNIPIGANGKIVGVYAVGRDITQLKRKKAEVRKIEEFHRALTDNILDIILTTNLLGKILYITPSCEHILGFTPEELIGKHISELFHKDDKDKAFSNRERLLTNLEHIRDSYAFRKKDGSLVWVEAICQPIIDPDTKNILEVVSVIRDITEIKQAEERIKSFFKNSADAIWVIDLEDTVLEVNPSFEKMFGWSKNEILGVELQKVPYIPDEYLNEANQLYEQVKNGKSIIGLETIRKNKSGDLLNVSITVFPFLDNNGNMNGRSIIFRNITAWKKAQHLLQNSEKLSVAGQLAAGIAHEVRNPLTAIKGFLQLMEAQSKYLSYFEVIQSEMDRIDQILNELLILAKPQDLKFGKENIQNIIEEIKTLIDTQAIMNNILIRVINECQNLKITCDKNQLKQVFINFLKNSIEAMPKGGEITIEIKQHGEDKVKIIFKDTGIGIPQHILKRIGEPFYTTKENGTGLGIMISKQIIENHNGNVNFWSDQNGTIIEVILPITIN